MACCIDVFFKGRAIDDLGREYDYAKDRVIFGIFVNGLQYKTIVLRPNQKINEAMMELSNLDGINPYRCSTCDKNQTYDHFRDKRAEDYINKSCFYFIM